MNGKGRGRIVPYHKQSWLNYELLCQLRTNLTERRNPVATGTEHWLMVATRPKFPANARDFAIGAAGEAPVPFPPDERLAAGHMKSYDPIFSSKHCLFKVHVFSGQVVYQRGI